MSRYISDQTLKIAQWVTAAQQKLYEARLEAKEPIRFPMGGGGVRQWNRMMALRPIPKMARKQKPKPEPEDRLTVKERNDLIRRSRTAPLNRPRRRRSGGEVTPG